MKVLIICFMLLICITAVIVIWDVRHFVVRKYVLTTSKIQKDYRFVMLSDLHGKSFGKNNEKLIQKIDELKPEGIFIAGDMLTAKPGRNFDTAVSLIKKLSEKYPLYYGSGNHEFRMEIYPEKYGNMSKDFETAIRHPNLFRLKNQKILLKKASILVYGLEIDREFYKKIHAPEMDKDYLEQKLGKPDKEAYTIMIAHNPAYFPVYAEYGPDLVLSGHVHGGIARLPLLGGVISPTLRLFPKYDGGLFKEGHTTMILGRGLGTHTLPIRFLNPGELVLVTLKANPSVRHGEKIK